MADLTDEEYAAATERGRILGETEPHARTARYDKRSGMLVLELTNGASFTCPTHSLQGLESASPDQLAQVELSGLGFGLHWEELDADFTVGGLLAGRFGTRAHMAKLHATLAGVDRDQSTGIAAE